MPIAEASGLAQFRQTQSNLGLDPDINNPMGQRAGQFDQFRSQVNPLLEQASTEANTRADNTFNQLRQAGLLNVANQFKQSQRSIAFDTARRGTLGGSRSTERIGDAQDAANQSVSGVLSNATQISNNQRRQELSPIHGMQQQIAAGDPFASQIAQNQVNSFQQQGNAATGQFDLGQSQSNLSSAHGMNQGQNISGLLGNLGTGIFGMVAKNQDRNQLNEINRMGGGF